MIVRRHRATIPGARERTCGDPDEEAEGPEETLEVWLTQELEE